MQTSDPSPPAPPPPPQSTPPQPTRPVPLGYERRAGVTPFDPTGGVRWKPLLIGSLRGVPGLVLIGALLMLVPSLIYAVVDPWFGGNSTTDAVETAARAACWATASLVLLLILHRIRHRKRRRPSPVVTDRIEN